LHILCRICDEDVVSMEKYWWDKAYFLEKNLSQCHPVHQISMWTGPGLNPSNPCDKPVTNCLSLSMTTFGGPLLISNPDHQLHWLEPFVILPSPFRQMPINLDWATTSFQIFTSSSFNTGNHSIMTALLNNSSIKCSYFILTIKAGCWVFTNLQTIKGKLDPDTAFLGSLLELFCMRTLSFQTSQL